SEACASETADDAVEPHLLDQSGIRVDSDLMDLLPRPPIRRELLGRGSRPGRAGRGGGPAGAERACGSRGTSSRFGIGAEAWVTCRLLGGMRYVPVFPPYVPVFPPMRYVPVFPPSRAERPGSPAVHCEQQEKSTQPLVFLYSLLRSRHGAF